MTAPRPSRAHAATAVAAGAAALIATALWRPSPARQLAAASAGHAAAIAIALGRPGCLSWEGRGGERERGGPRACEWCTRTFHYRGPGAVVCSSPCGDNLARLHLTHPERAGDAAFVAAWREVLDAEQDGSKMGGG